VSTLLRADVRTIQHVSRKEKIDLKEILDKIVEGRIDANRKYVDEVLEKIQDANHRDYLEKLAIEVTRMELEEKAGNLQRAFQHKVLAENYKGILEKAFGISHTT
jgi:hypothetical protein